MFLKSKHKVRLYIKRIHLFKSGVEHRNKKIILTRSKKIHLPVNQSVANFFSNKKNPTVWARKTFDRFHKYGTKGFVLEFNMFLSFETFVSYFRISFNKRFLA